MLDGTKDLYEMSKKLLAFCEKYKDEIPYDDLNNLHELWSRIYNNLQTEEQGTVYTGDAPSTEASFYKKTFVGVSETDYKKDKVNGATVIDLVIDLLKNGKVQQAIWELQDHLTTVQTEDLDNQAYSEGEGYR